MAEHSRESHWAHTRTAWGLEPQEGQQTGPLISVTWGLLP